MSAQTWKREPLLLKSLDAAVPGILASQKTNGQFGTEPWVSNDQEVLLPLAAAWSLKDSAHFGSERVLEAIVRGGAALIDAQDEKGMFTFRKKDNSTWGQTFRHTVFSRWVRAFGIIRRAMSEGRIARWSAALEKGYDGIAGTSLGHIHNIPTHHAMGLYCAGEVFGRGDWMTRAREFLRGAAGAQSEHGWWAEHEGPTVLYNFAYIQALGVYYAMSGDGEVLEALRRAALYHSACTYPDGSPVETLDGRNPYRAGVQLGNAGFSHTAEGRGFLARQHGLFLRSGSLFDADYAAEMLLYGCDGHVKETATSKLEHSWGMDDRALITRRGPWFTVLSAFTTGIPLNRWGQDRQNFVSVFHDKAGLIIGGGNTKLQPLWSTFTVGNTALLRHEQGEEAPDFAPGDGLMHVPGRAWIEPGGLHPSLALVYGGVSCRVTLRPLGSRVLELELAVGGSTGLPVEAHLTLVPRLGEPAQSAVDGMKALGEKPFDWRSPRWLEHAGWRLSVPGRGRVVWPVLPHNPYRKDGSSFAPEGRIVVAVPFDEKARRHKLTLTVGGSRG